MSERVIHRTVEARDHGRVADATKLAHASGADLVSGQIEQDEYRIVLFDDREELWDTNSRRHGMPLSFRNIDLRTGAGNLSKKQPLAKAIGSAATTILDATAGLGHDAALLACMGWTTLAIERDPFIATLLAISRDDARRCDDLWSRLETNLTIKCGDAIELIQNYTPDVIYLDPMFSARRKSSALPKKPAQVLQALAAAGGEAKLLAAARRSVSRVVVKRPQDGPPIEADPTLVFNGRLVRYDVYLQQ
ncbi:MAG: class I SAM-dependent methyltransferase [Phycisphaerales bacterium]|nr:class I SAM-dependent methyltransferase [Phycisphaerales bacterium]